MSRHLIDQRRDEMPSGMVARYLKLERQRTAMGPHPAFLALSRKPREGWGHVDQYLRIERGKLA